jgi:hypothetical protein
LPSSSGTPTLVVDGLDELGARHSEDLSKLLGIIDSTKNSALWVCASRPRPEIEEFARRTDANVVGLGLLSHEARRDFLCAELREPIPGISEADRLLFMSDPWINQVTMKLDAGLPQYLRAVLDSIRASEYRDPDKIPPSMEAIRKSSTYSTWRK